MLVRQVVEATQLSAEQRQAVVRLRAAYLTNLAVLSRKRTVLTYRLQVRTLNPAHLVMMLCEAPARRNALLCKLTFLCRASDVLHPTHMSQQEDLPCGRWQMRFSLRKTMTFHRPTACAGAGAATGGGGRRRRRPNLRGHHGPRPAGGSHRRPAHLPMRRALQRRPGTPCGGVSSSTSEMHMINCLLGQAHRHPPCSASVCLLRKAI